MTWTHTIFEKKVEAYRYVDSPEVTEHILNWTRKYDVNVEHMLPGQIFFNKEYPVLYVKTSQPFFVRPGFWLVRNEEKWYSVYPDIVEKLYIPIKEEARGAV